MTQLTMTPKRWATFGMIVALIALFGVVVWSSMTPAPTPTEIDAKFSAQERQGRSDLEHAKQRLVALEKSRTTLLWAGKTDGIGSQLLARVTKETDASGLKMQAFRPQRALEMNGLVMLPYSLSVEGNYPAVLHLIRFLETGDQKLFVQMVQVAASDDRTDQVAATLGIAVFIRQENTKT